jgi:aldose sugar dehydrogenase
MNASLTETLSKAPLLRAAWLATVALLAACGGGGGSMPEAVAPATADRAEAAAAPAAAVRIEGVYRLENRCSGKVLDVAGVSTALRARIHLWEWWGGANQQWRIEPLGDGTHRLVAQHSGRVLDAPPDAVNEDGVPLFHQWDWHGGANQRFVIDDLGDGSHRLTVQHSQKLLDVRGAGAANGTTIWQWPWNGSCAQRWVLTRLDGSGTPAVTRNTFLGGLANPWDATFTPDGAMLYTERGRGLSVRLANGAVRPLFTPGDLAVQEQSGMLGIALDPDFANTRAVYAYMSSSAGGAVDNRVVRVTVNADYSAVSGRADIVTGISYAAGAHSGGRIRFGPDGLLYITTGDNRTGSIPQDVRVLGGKVLRVDRNGNAAPGNNPPPGGDARLFTHGHRNPQGLAFRPGSGAPFLIEHGPNFQDEVTPLRAGGNGGWDPLCADRVGYCGYDNVTQMTDLVKFPDAMRPAWSSGSAVGSSRGTAGGAFVSGAQWRDWNGALVIAMLSGRRLEVLRLTADGNGTLGTAPLFDTLGQRLRFVVQGPDGALYVGTDGRSGGDEIWRVTPQ